MDGAMNDLSNDNHKICSTCGELKLSSEFHARKNSKCGTRSSCKDCLNKQFRNKYRETNPEIKRENFKAFEINGELFKFCNTCKKDVLASSFYALSKKGGYGGRVMSRCKECDDAARVKKRSTIKGRYTEYKSGAKYRGIDWMLSIEDFSALWNAPCSYCGSNIETCGIDRVDSRLGYTKENITSSCRQCNQSKMDQSLDDFVAWVKRAYNHLSNSGMID
jgi:hypothetical protein